MDINKELAKDLKALDIKNLYYYYPDKEPEFPIVTYYVLTERAHAGYDNTEYATFYAAEVDVYSKNPAEAARIAETLIDGLTPKGWVREYSRDLPPSEGVFHKTIRFSKVFIK